MCAIFLRGNSIFRNGRREESIIDDRTQLTNCVPFQKTTAVGFLLPTSGRIRTGGSGFIISFLRVGFNFFAVKRASFETLTSYPLTLLLGYLREKTFHVFI